MTEETREYIRMLESENKMFAEFIDDVYDYTDADISLIANHGKNAYKIMERNRK